jgi:hypothetical protein
MAREKRLQIPIAFSVQQRERLEAAAVKAGRSLAAEVRQRLERSFSEDDLAAATRDLIDYIQRLEFTLKHFQTANLDWFGHAAAHWAFRNGITAWLQRRRPAGERAFGPGELLPNERRWVSSDDPAIIGEALEAALFSSGKPLSYERLRELREEFVRQIAERHPETAELAERYLQELQAAREQEHDELLEDKKRRELEEQQKKPEQEQS